MTIYQTLKLVMTYHIINHKINFWERTKLKEIWECMGDSIGEDPPDSEMITALHEWQVNLIREIGKRFLITKDTRL